MLTTGLAHGGAETQVVFLAKGLKDRGWDVALESMLPPQAFEETLEISAIPLIPLCMRRGVPDPRAIARLARHWRSFRPHIVHSHMIHANILARVTRMIAPVPVLISTAHSVQEGAG